MKYSHIPIFALFLSCNALGKIQKETKREFPLSTHSLGELGELGELSATVYQIGC